MSTDALSLVVALVGALNAWIIVILTSMHKAANENSKALAAIGTKLATYAERVDNLRRAQVAMERDLDAILRRGK